MVLLWNGFHQLQVSVGCISLHKWKGNFPGFAPKKHTKETVYCIYSFIYFDPFFFGQCTSNLIPIVPVRSSLLALIIFMFYRHKLPFLLISEEVSTLNSQNII